MCKTECNWWKRASKPALVRLGLLFFVLGWLSTIDATCAEQTSEVEAGTLNLVLANKNGFVIATDSKATGSGQPRYDSQKLFRTGPRTAVAVAGLAAVNLPEPFQFEIAALISSHFGPTGLSDGRGSLNAVDEWLTSDISAELDRLFTVYSVDGYFAEPFVATLVGFNDGGVSEIRVIDFVPTRRALGLRGELFPHFEPKEDRVTASSFRFVTVGVDKVARGVLVGEYSADSDSVRAYVSRLDRGRLDDMPLGDMKSLALAIFEATKGDSQASQVVGGDTQIGVFPTNGKDEWVQQSFPTRQPLFTRTSLVIGASLSPKAQSPTEAGGAIEMVYQFGGPLTPFRSIYVANEFRDEEVILAGSIFAGNIFRHCVLKSGAGYIFRDNNRCLNSVLEVQTDNAVRRVALTESCRPQN